MQGIATREIAAGNGTVRRPIVSTERKMITKQQQTFFTFEAVSRSVTMPAGNSHSTPGWP